MSQEVEGYTNNVYPGPAGFRIISPSGNHNENDNHNTKDTPNLYSRDSSTHFRSYTRPLLEPPKPREELRKRQSRDDNSMRRKRHIIQLYRRRKPMIPRRVLTTYLWGVGEYNIRYEVCCEAHDIDGGEIDRGTRRRFAAEVKNRLRVER